MTLKQVCKSCSLHFFKESALNLHQKVIHQNGGTKQKVLMVLIEEKEVKKFYCNFCESVFALNIHFSKHMLEVHGISKRHCECSNFGKKFKSESGLVYHTTSFHERKREHKCHRCDSSFALQGREFFPCAGAAICTI